MRGHRSGPSRSRFASWIWLTSTNVSEETAATSWSVADNTAIADASEDRVSTNGETVEDAGVTEVVHGAVRLYADTSYAGISRTHVAYGTPTIYARRPASTVGGHILVTCGFSPRRRLTLATRS